MSQPNDMHPGAHAMAILSFIRLALLSGLASIAVASALAAQPERTLPVDPVELVSGREVAGKPELALEREGIEYRFATPESKAAFEKDPARYEVADGGACGRMGPLSGLGDARRYAVSGGHIFFFASDGCREAFLKDPVRFIEIEDEKLFGSHEQVVAGRATLDKFVAWAGGAERLKTIRTYRAVAARKEMQGEKEWAVTNETAISFPNGYFQKEAWNESWFSTSSSAEGGAMASARGNERIADSRTRAFNRSLARLPIVILKAHVDGAPGADCPGLIVIGDGEGAIDGSSVEFVKVWLNGAASRLAIDKGTGRLLQLSFSGRDSTSSVGDSVRTYTMLATVAGITLPTAYTVSFNGKDLPSAAAKIDAFEINPQLPKDTFAIPKTFDP